MSSGSMGAVPQGGVPGSTIPIPRTKRTYYADAVNGDDTAAAADLTGKTPYRTLQPAVNRMYLDGYGFFFPTLDIAAGTYNGDVRFPRGSNMILQGKGVTTVFDGSAIIDDRTYVILDGMKAQRTPKEGDTQTEFRFADVSGVGAGAELWNIEYGSGFSSALMAQMGAVVYTRGTHKTTAPMNHFGEVQDGGLWEHSSSSTITCVNPGTNFAFVFCYFISSVARINGTVSITGTFRRRYDPGDGLTRGAIYGVATIPAGSSEPTYPPPETTTVAGNGVVSRASF